MEQDAYQTAVTKLLAYLDQTVSFAQGQLPDIANQILTYGAYDALLGMWICIIISILMIGVSILNSLQYGDFSGISAFFALIISTGFFIGAMGNFSTYKKIELAPKVYVIEQVKDMLIEPSK